VHTKIEYKLLNIGTVREYFLLLTLSILRLQQPPLPQHAEGVEAAAPCTPPSRQ